MRCISPYLFQGLAKNFGTQTSSGAVPPGLKALFFGVWLMEICNYYVGKTIYNHIYMMMMLDIKKMVVNIISTMFNVRYHILMICIDILKTKVLLTTI